jgi:hypothetical protein
MDSTNFDTFDSPAGGVELSDTLSSWRKKTNGIITKISSEATELDTLQTKVNNFQDGNNTVALTKVQQVAANKLLGNVGSGNGNVAEVEIDVTASGLQNSDDTIPSSKAVKDYVDSLFDEYSLKQPTSNATGTFNLTTTFTDIDLSSAVGSNKALVVLSLQDGSRSAEGAYFRTNGETWAAYTNQFDGATALVVGSSEKGGHIVIMTDAAGKIEGRSDDNSINAVKYKVLAFQKQRV